MIHFSRYFTTKINYKLFSLSTFEMLAKGRGFTSPHDSKIFHFLSEYNVYRLHDSHSWLPHEKYRTNRYRFRCVEVRMRTRATIRPTPVFISAVFVHKTKYNKITVYASSAVARPYTLYMLYESINCHFRISHISEWHHYWGVHNNKQRLPHAQQYCASARSLSFTHTHTDVFVYPAKYVYFMQLWILQKKHYLSLSNYFERTIVIQQTNCSLIVH